MKFLILFFLLLSCSPKEKAENKIEKILTRLVFSEKIIELNDQLIQNIRISEPKGTWQFLFKVKVKVDRESYLIDCLFYKVPTLEEKGILKLSSQNKGEDCSGNYLEKGVIEIKKIEGFSFSETEKGVAFTIDQIKYQANFLNRKRAKELKLFQSDKDESPFLFSKDIFDLAPAKLYQEAFLSHRESCHTLTNDCEEKLEYQCDKCPQSVFTQVISSNCRKTYNKICGDISCGGVGEIACIRGFAASEFKLSYCMNDSPVGFCNAGLRVYCKEDVLVCNY